MKAGNHAIAITGKFPRVARLRDEWYDFADDPAPVISKVKELPARANLFTFLQEVHELEPKHTFHLEHESVSVLPITTYDHWWTKQINDKTRNMIRKAGKSGVDLRPAEADDTFIDGVVAIYNETPVRQGKRFWHYGKEFATIKQELITFFDRSKFVGAYHGNELIGFFKLTRNANSASLMQIISKMAHRNKAPNNALLAKAVEMCAESHIPFLQYGVWSQGGLGEYKVRHGFVRFDVPRYYVPLDPIGRFALTCGLHKDLTSLIPAGLRTRASALRGAWYSYKQEKWPFRKGAVA